MEGQEGRVGEAGRPRLLLVEDDRDLSGLLAGLLDEEGYAVQVARDGQQGLHLGLSRSWDVLVVDRGLPAIEGVDLLARLRSRGVRAPVLMLTARGTVADRVEGLDAGANDYLVKPFDVEELLARLRALLRRPADQARNCPWATASCSSTRIALWELAARTFSCHEGRVTCFGCSLSDRAGCSVATSCSARCSRARTRPVWWTRTCTTSDASSGASRYGPSTGSAIAWAARDRAQSRARAGDGLDARDRLMLRSAARRIALQSAALLTLVVAFAVIGVAVVFDHAQHAEIERTVRQAARTADDVSDPPPGVLLVRAQDGSVALTPGAPPGLRALATLPGGLGSAAVGRHHYLTFAGTRGDARYVAAYDLAAHHREEVRLLWTSVVGGLLGIGLAAGAGLLIGRSAVRPLAEALTRQRRFVTDASHELRTPLTVLHTRAQLVRRRLLAGASPAGAAELDQLVEDTSVLGEVISDLLLSAQLQSDRLAGRTVDVRDLAEGVVRSLRPYADGSGTSLGAEVASGDWRVQGAPAALRRALGALVDNAISHAPRGVVTIRVDGDEERVRLSVKDDGEGFDPADRDLLIDRFSRGPGDGAHRRFGLGLALVDEVVRAHDGTLELNGAPGEGAEMTMVLPRS